MNINTYRFIEHCGPSQDDNLKYREEKELDYWKKQDPLINFKKFLNKKDLSDIEIKLIKFKKDTHRLFQKFEEKKFTDIKKFRKIDIYA